MTARLFVVAAARDLGVSDETAEDLRLAASELVANAIESGEPGPIRLSLRSDPRGVDLDASGVGTLMDAAPISRRALLTTLFEATDLSDGGSVHIRVNLSSTAVIDEA